MDPPLRSRIPALGDCRYLNTGASGPSPRQVVEAAGEFHREHKYRAPCGDGMYDVAEAAMESARESVAGFVGATPGEIALTRSTVEGINHVATSIDWSEGDVVVRTDLEHPAGTLPWERMADLHGVETRTVDTERGRLDTDSVIDAVGDAGLVCLSSVSWNYGTRLPVSEVVDIAHDAGARVLVDAVQTPGQMPLDVSDWGADFVAASGHKWLLGLWGSGFLYVDRDALETLRPRRIGYASVETDVETGYRFRPDAGRFELGTREIAPHASLETAIEVLEEVGIGSVEDRIATLTDHLMERLGDRLVSPRDARSGLVSFAAEKPDELVDRLARQGIRIRALPEPQACRASVHVFNTRTDIDRLVDAL